MVDYTRFNLRFVIGGGTPNGWVTDSLVSFTLYQRLIYSSSYLDAVLLNPPKDEAGTDLVWGTNVTRSTKVVVYLWGTVQFVGRIEDWRVDGNFIRVRVVTDAQTKLDQIYSGSFGSTDQHTLVGAVAAAAGLTVYNGTRPTHSESITGATYDKMSVRDVLKRALDMVDPTTQKVQVVAQHTFSDYHISVADYGGSGTPAMTVSVDTNMLEPPVWNDAVSRVINHVIVKYTSGEATAEDATSISAYGRRSAILYRPEVDNATDAQAIANSIVLLLKDPKESCTVKLMADGDLIDYDTLGYATYTVIDPVTGKTANMAIKRMTIQYPDEIAEVTFDQVGLNTEEYQASVESRVEILEANVPNQKLNATSSPTFDDVAVNGTSVDGFITGHTQGGQAGEYYHLTQAAYNNLYQQDQEVKSTSSPTFALLNISNADGTAMFGPANSSFCHIYTDRPAFVFDKSISCNPSGGLDLGLSNRYWRHLYMNGNLMMSGSVLADESKNVCANSLITGLIKPADTSSVDGVANFTFNGANRGWLRFRRGGSSQACGVLLSAYDTRHFFLHADGDLFKIDYNGSLDYGTATNMLSLSNVGNLSIAGNYWGGRLYLSSSAHSTDMMSITNTSANVDDRVNLSINRTNQSGTMLYLSLYDAKNGSWAGLSCKAIKINNLTVAIDTNNVHTASKINLTGTTYQIRCDSDVMFTNLAQNAYVGVRARFLDIQGSACIDASKNITCNNLTVAGTCTLPGIVPFNSTASANTRNFFDAPVSFLPGADYVKRKTITFTNGLGPGTYRVYFEAAVQSGGGIVYARVYKNGSAIGTARSTESTAYTAWSQDFGGPLEPGDTIELWAYHSGDAGYYGYVRYFRVQYDLSLPTTMPATNS